MRTGFSDEVSASTPVSRSYLLRLTLIPGALDTISNSAPTSVKLVRGILKTRPSAPVAVIPSAPEIVTPSAPVAVMPFACYLTRISASRSDAIRTGCSDSVSASSCNSARKMNLDRVCVISRSVSAGSGYSICAGCCDSVGIVELASESAPVAVMPFAPCR